MGIIDATEGYESWLRQQIAVNETDLKAKHRAMASATFPFLRATFYRWAERLPELYPQIFEAPAVCAVGDLHVENFGTWRDAEGRLVWGINDFDEAHTLPYTSDLIRLATSIELARAENSLSISLETACKALLEGYRKALETGGRPFVLEEKHDWLRDTATGDLRHPVAFWAKLEKGGEVTPESLPENALAVLKKAVPERATLNRIRQRQAGLGSLGRPRFVGIAGWEGGNIAREVKASVPSAVCWARGANAETPTGMETLLKTAVRCPDPFAHLEQGWIVRRLAPHCTRIELAEVPKERDEERLFHAMGYETGNVHLASEFSVLDVLRHLEKWDVADLREQASVMVAAVRRDHREWREAQRMFS